ncbi:hypothetical protein BH20ACT9_BH20ACT9_01220 [soil metagenome]
MTRYAAPADRRGGRYLRLWFATSEPLGRIRRALRDDASWKPTRRGTPAGERSRTLA